jgi:hypothetical protein
VHHSRIHGRNPPATGSTIFSVVAAFAGPKGASRLRPLTTAALPLAALTALAAFATTALWMGGGAAPAGAATTGAAATTTTAPPATTTTTTAAATTTTAAPTNASTTTTFPAGATKADKWVIRAITAEQKFGSVHVVGKITQGKSQIVLELLVNSDGEGGGEFVQDGNLIKIERVGPLLYFNAPHKFWATHATAAQAKTYGGKWIEFSAVDSRFTSFDQFLSAADLVVAAFQGHTAPLTVSKPTTFAGHKVVIVKDTVTTHGKKSTGLMYIAAKGPALVYKIVDDTPGNVSTVVFQHYGKGVTLTVPPNAINLT